MRRYSKNTRGDEIQVTKFSSRVTLYSSEEYLRKIKYK